MTDHTPTLDPRSTLSPGRVLIHVAGPVTRHPDDPDQRARQTCVRCGADLIIRRYHPGWPEGAHVEVGPGYVGMVLCGGAAPLCALPETP